MFTLVTLCDYNISDDEGSDYENDGLDVNDVDDNDDVMMMVMM